MERLREVWGGSWSGALSSDQGEVVKARQVLRKVLATPIHVKPTPGDDPRDRRWTFAGLARFDEVLAGGLGQDGYYAARWNHGTPEQIIARYAEASAGSVRTARSWSIRSISGGSGDGDTDGRSTDMAPHTPPGGSERPGNPWRSSSAQS